MSELPVAAVRDSAKGSTRPNTTTPTGSDTTELRPARMNPHGSGSKEPHPERLRWSANQLRAALRQLSQTRRFLESVAGGEFLKQLERHLVPGVRASAGTLGLGNDWAQPHEVINTLIVGLGVDDGKIARYIAETAHDPWAYLARCSIKWCGGLWGVRGVPLEQVTAEHVEATLHVQRFSEAEETLTPLAQVVALTHGALVPYTPSALTQQLNGLLGWLASNPPQRSSHETEDRNCAAHAFTQFTRPQIAAVMNIAWGGRPRRRETSLFAAFLLDHEFRPSDSPTHARALLHYRQVMRSHQAKVTRLERIAA